MPVIEQQGDAVTCAARNIRARRKQLRLTQREVAEALDVAPLTVLKYEQGATLTVERLEQLAKVLWCSASDLLNPSWQLPPPHESYPEMR